jgi:putative peptidoglycan lipid II flippase
VIGDQNRAPSAATVIGDPSSADILERLDQHTTATRVPEADGASTYAHAAETRRVLTVAAMVGFIVLAGNLLGFVRDLLIADLFGASAKTDAFLVAWTIPETTSTLLLEGAMVYVLVPLLASEITAYGNVRALVRRTLGPLLALLATMTVLTAVAAPIVAKVAAPGLENTAVAVTSLRYAAVTIFFMGAAGYLCAVLRAHGRFVVPAFVYIAYNVGIIGLIVAGHARLGILSAAIGLAVGSALMALVQVPAFLRVAKPGRLSLRVDRSLLLEISAFVPIGLFFLFRQLQVYVERFLGSFLNAGSISHLNYSMKTAQVPVTFALGVAIVSFPVIARHAAAQDRAAVRSWLERTLRLVVALILPAVVWLIAFAPDIISTLYRHGEFTSGDASATASIMRIYSIGLVGQVVVSVAVLAFFATRSRLWLPVAAALTGLAVDAIVGLALLGPLEAKGLALGNALGILTMGVVLVVGIHRTVEPLDLVALVRGTVELVAVAAAAGVIAWAAAEQMPASVGSLVHLSVGGAIVIVLYPLIGRAFRVREMEPVFDLVRRHRARRNDDRSASNLGLGADGG